MANPEGFEEFGEDDPRFSMLTEQVEERGRKMGLYLDHLSLHPIPVPGKAMMIATFRMGDLAMSQRMLDTERARDDDMIRQMDDALLEEQAEEIARRLREGRPFD